MQRWDSWCLTQQIRLFMLDEGESCWQFAETIAVKFIIVGQSAELDPRIDKADPRLQQLRDGIPLLQDLIRSDSWRKDQALTLNSAIEAAQTLKRSVQPFWLNLVQITMKETL